MDATTALILLGATAASSAAAMYNNRQNIKYASEANLESVNLANTAHQREVRDLEAAGLNPILSSSSSGSSTPVLKTPGLESIDGGITSNAGSIARSLNGMTKAEVESAKADASTARAYADRAQELASSEVLRSEAEAKKANGEAAASNVQGLNSLIDEAARTEAFTGRTHEAVIEAIGDDKKGWNTYNNLVQQYRNQVQSGRYNSSLTRSIYNDVISGASTATDIYGAVRAGQRDSFNKNYKQVEKFVEKNGKGWRVRSYERK